MSKKTPEELRGGADVPVGFWVGVIRGMWRFGREDGPWVQAFGSREEAVGAAVHAAAEADAIKARS